MSIREKMKESRKEKGLGLAGMADFLGMDTVDYARIEYNNDLIDPAIIPDLSRILEIPAEEFQEIVKTE